MRDTIEYLGAGCYNLRPQTESVFNQLGNNLRALSFLIDMLNYQRAGWQLFV
jgi:hypothetical protein